MKTLAALLLTGALAASGTCGAQAAPPAQPGSGAPGAVFKRIDGPPLTAAQVDWLVEQEMKRHNVPGAAIALLNHGAVVYEKAYGFRDVAKRLPLTEDSVMSAASLTKAAFATMVLQLVREEVIDLDEHVVKYLKKPLAEYPGYEELGKDERAQHITMRQLLEHGSGLPNLRQFEPDGKLRLIFPPGTRYAYSGEGYRLAQLVVSEVTGKTAEELMAERLFKPLNMTRTSMVWQPRFESDFANGYDEQGKLLGPERRTRADAAGSMQTTVKDYAAFLAGVLDGTVLPVALRDREMLRPQVKIRSRHQFPTNSTETTMDNNAIELSYGLGWGIYQGIFGETFFKEGHDDGWRHYAAVVAPAKTGLLIMTNSGNGDAMYDGLLRGLLGATQTPLAWEGFPPEK